MSHTDLIALQLLLEHAHDQLEDTITALVRAGAFDLANKLRWAQSQLLELPPGLALAMRRAQEGCTDIAAELLA